MNIKFKKTWTLGITLSLLSLVASAQVGLIPGANDPSKADIQVISQDGKLVSTTITPTVGQANFYVVGTDEGYIDVNDLKLFIAELTKDRSQIFKMRNQEDHFAVVPPPEPGPITEPQDVKTKSKAKKSKSKTQALQARKN